MDRPVKIAFGWRLPDWALDVIPVALLAVTGASAIMLQRASVVSVSIAWHWLGLAVCLLALLVRHRAPLAVLGVTLAATLAIDDEAVTLLPVLLALLAVAERCDRARVALALAASAAHLAAVEPLHGGDITAAFVAPRMIVLGLAVAVGLYVRARADYIGGLAERAERLEREQELLAGRAAAEERVRIARELHDVVAHNVALMVVQTQALAATRGGDDEARAALGRVAGLGREALSEMHHMLGVLRLQDGDGAERAPQPGVHDLEALVAQIGESGVATELVVEGVPCDLPPGVDLSAYRIVQEALTNVIRHAEASRATVVLRYEPGALLVTVTDDGRGAQLVLAGGPSSPDEPGPVGDGTADRAGHGLVGMRERAALFGGALHAGPAPGGRGYRVHAVLPTAT